MENKPELTEEEKREETLKSLEGLEKEFKSLQDTTQGISDGLRESNTKGEKYLDRLNDLTNEVIDDIKKKTKELLINNTPND